MRSSGSIGASEPGTIVDSPRGGPCAAAGERRRDACRGVPAEVLWPRNTWTDLVAYDTQARTLARMFAENVGAYSDRVEPDVRAAGPADRAGFLS